MRARQTVRLGKWLRVNLSKSGASLSIGRPGATINVGAKNTRATLGVPGSGISFTKNLTARKIEPSFAPRPILRERIEPTFETESITAPPPNRDDPPRPGFIWRYILRPILKFLLWCWLIGIIATIVVALFGPTDTTNPVAQVKVATAAEKLSTTTFGTAYHCIETIRNNLHNPANAELPRPIDVPVTVLKNKLFEARIRGRAENGFGAIRRMTWRCKVKSDGESWIVVSIREN